MHFGETWRPILGYLEEPRNEHWLLRQWQEIKEIWSDLHQVKLRYNKSWEEDEFLQKIGAGSGVMLFIHGIQ